MTTPEPVRQALDVKITSGPHGNHTTLYINGEKVTNAYSFTLHAAADDLTRLTIEYVNVKVEVEGVVEETAMGSKTREYRQVRLVEPDENPETK